MTDEESTILIRIGQELANLVENDPNGAYVYAEVREGFMSANGFHDEGNRVVNLDTSRALCDAIWDLWYERETEKRWEVMHYEITDGQYAVEFEYPDQIDPDEFLDERAGRALKARYGDKPIYYPPPEDLPELTEADLSDEEYLARNGR